jgi:HD-like signal output (HDOD) protein
MKRMKILFVDEDCMRLKELRSLLDSDSDRWDISFVEDGLSAIEQLQNYDFDVIVTDLSMPIIDGHQLLVIVRERFPSVIRIVFSECEDQKELLEVAPLIHRFIPKPCSEQTLRRTIENTLYIYVALDNSAIRKVLIKTTSLPTVPVVYNRLMAEIDSEEFSLREAAEIISSDMGLTANILKHVNHLGLSEQVSDIDQAVALLGLDAIRGIALTTHIFHSMGNISIEHFSLEDTMERSFLTALFAKQIVMIEEGIKEMADDAFVAGLLHQLGTLVFVTNFPAKYEAVLERVVNANRPITAVEVNLLGVSHAKVGAHLLALWGMRESILNGVAFYASPDEIEGKGFSVTTAVYCAAKIADAYMNWSEEDEGVNLNLTEDVYLSRIDFASDSSRWIEECGILYRGLLHG